MGLLYLSIPFMVLAVAIATVPLLAMIKHQHARDEFAPLVQGSQAPREAEKRSMAA